MIAALDDLIERRIRDAQQAGQFDGLPGQGRPLQWDEPPLVPEDVRVAYRVLRNAGLVPPEVDALRQPAFEDEGRDDDGRDAGAGDCQPPGEPRDSFERRVSRRLLAVTLALERQGVTLSGPAMAAYRKALCRKFSAGRPAGSPRINGDDR